MATIQVKRLKSILKEIGIKENVHLRKYPRCCKNPETGKIERFNEYGAAYAVIMKKYWTPNQIELVRSHQNLTVLRDSELCLLVES